MAFVFDSGKKVVAVDAIMRKIHPTNEGYHVAFGRGGVNSPVKLSPCSLLAPAEKQGDNSAVI